MEEKLFKECLKIRNNESKKTYEQLNEEFGKPYKNGESLRGAIKKELKHQNKLPSRKEAVDKEVQSKLDEIDMKIHELEKQKVKIRTLNLELSRYRREEAREELLYEQIKEEMKTLDTPMFRPLYKSINQRKKGWVLGLSDIHFNSYFEILNNSYSIEIVKDRFNTLLNDMVEIINKEKISKIIVLNNGDSIQGLIHLSDIKINQTTVVKSVVEFSRFMAEWLNELSKYVEVTYIQPSTSNHTELRIFDTKAGNTDENLEYIIINYITDLLKNNNRIKVISNLETNFVRFNLCGYEFITMHGHGIKSINNVLDKLTAQHRVFFDYAILGHLHSGQVLTSSEGNTNNRQIIVLPSIVGSDPYSQSLMLGSKSEAKLMCFEETKGNNITYNLILN